LVPDLFLQLTDDEFERPALIPTLSDEEALKILAEGEFVGSKLIPWGSNYTFAVAICIEDGREQLAIYKPRDGENPLYDFPHGTLYLREVAAYRFAKLLGWCLVPPTVVREGPMGIGSLQLYKTPAEPAEPLDPRDYWSAKSIEIERLVLFDHIANNADRKLSHCLLDADGRVWGIDHGLCFNVDMKLRTVLWQFVGGPVRDNLIADLRLLQERKAEIREELRGLLNEREITALLRRIDVIVADGIYPILNPHRNIPYGWW
jgi:hypothetical protein